MWNGHTRSSGISMGIARGPGPLIKALCSVDLDKHVSFIRRAWARGDSAQQIGDEIGVTATRIRNNAKRMKMARYIPPSLNLPHDKTQTPISSPVYGSYRGGRS